MGGHINKDGKFQSDKYPTCPPGKVPLSTADPMAQDLLWEYARRRNAVDAEFADDVQACLLNDDFPFPKDVMLLSERPVILGLTSAAVRLLGLCRRDQRKDLVDRAAVSLRYVVAGLEEFASHAGSDTGAENTVLVLRQIVGWLEGYDYESALAVAKEREADLASYKRSIEALQSPSTCKAGVGDHR